MSDNEAPKQDAPVTPPQAATVDPMPPRPEPAPHRSGTTAIISTILLTAVCIGGIYATYPVWQPHVARYIPALETDPILDPRVSGLTNRIQMLEARLSEQASQAKSSAGADNMQGNALADLEAERKKFSEDLAGTMGRLNSLEQALAGVQKIVEATTPPVASGTANQKTVLDLRARLARIEEQGGVMKAALDRLDAKAKTAPAQGVDVKARSVQSDAMLAELKAITARIGALETKPQAKPVMASTAAIKKAAAHDPLVVAIGGMREALRSSNAYTDALQSLQTQAPADHVGIRATIADLKPYADDGIPTVGDLRQMYVKTASNVVASVAVMDGNDWMSRSVNKVASLVSVRKMDEAEARNPMESTLARVDRLLRDGALADAVAELETLTGPQAAAAAPWLNAAHTRLMADKAVADLHTHAVAVLASVVATPGVQAPEQDEPDTAVSDEVTAPAEVPVDGTDGAADQPAVSTAKPE